MDTLAYIAKVQAAGFSLAVDGDRLLVSPVELLSDTQRQSLRARKSELIAALANPGTVLDADRGHDLAPANCPLSARLALAAERACREIHGDNDDQVAQMLADLAECPESDWDSLADHFDAQLPPPPEEGRERITLQADAYQFDMDVPVALVPAFVARASVRFKLVGNGGGGSLLGEPGKTEAELREILAEKYRGRLESINGEAP